MQNFWTQIVCIQIRDNKVFDTSTNRLSCKIDRTTLLPSFRATIFRLHDERPDFTSRYSYCGFMYACMYRLVRSGEAEKSDVG